MSMLAVVAATLSVAAPGGGEFAMAEGRGTSSQRARSLMLTGFVCHTYARASISDSLVWYGF